MNVAHSSGFCFTLSFNLTLHHVTLRNNSLVPKDKNVFFCADWSTQPAAFTDNTIISVIFSNFFNYWIPLVTSCVYTTNTISDWWHIFNHFVINFESDMTTGPKRQMWPVLTSESIAPHLSLPLEHWQG